MSNNNNNNNLDDANEFSNMLYILNHNINILKEKLKYLNIKKNFAYTLVIILYVINIILFLNIIITIYYSLI